jgi:hypothetical protein
LQLEQIYKALNAPAIKTSTLQIWKRASPSNSRLFQAPSCARRVNIRMPATETVYTLLKLLESTRKQSTEPKQS